MSVCIKVSVNMSGTIQSCLVLISLRSKRFRLVSEQRKTEERDFRHFSRGLWLPFFVLWSEIARNRLLRRLSSDCILTLSRHAFTCDSSPDASNWIARGERNARSVTEGSARVAITGCSLPNRASLVNISELNTQQDRRGTLCDKRDNNFVWNNSSPNFTRL